ncbi:26S proteasome non-ATPase regulatory subunit 7-like B, partial [Mucuna pruriens]
MRSYLDRVIDGKLPVNHEILYHLQLLPNLNVADLIKAFAGLECELIENEYTMLITYLSSLITNRTDCSKSASIITPSMTWTRISLFLTSTTSDRILLTTSIPSMSFETYKGNPDKES